MFRITVHAFYMLSVHRQRQVAESDLLQHVRRSADQQRIVFGHLSFQQVVHLLDKRLAVIVVFVFFLYAEARFFRLPLLRSVLRHLHHPVVDVLQRRRVLRQPFHLLEGPRPAQVFAPHRVLFRKNTGDLCALARFALQLDRAMMILHGVLYDGQAEPGSA